MKLFSKNDNFFVCEHCNKEVNPLNYTSRDHCPYCLYSKHVDINPGDRAEECKGLLVPVGMEPNPKKGYMIIFRCQKCGMIRKNKAAEDDNMDLLISLSARHDY